ncbi:MAG: type II secretion system protein [Candidatus Berkelbacteria bacterium]|nr:type II secretion system protein [Candidatus Berkelbacteria bacterium]
MLRRRHGLTLIELLVVVAAIAFLAGTVNFLHGKGKENRDKAQQRALDHAPAMLALPPADEVLERGTISAGYVTYEVKRDPKGKMTKDTIPVIYTYHVNAQSLSMDNFQATLVPEEPAVSNGLRNLVPGDKLSYYAKENEKFVKTTVPAPQPCYITVGNKRYTTHPNPTTYWDINFP